MKVWIYVGAMNKHRQVAAEKSWKDMPSDAPWMWTVIVFIGVVVPTIMFLIYFTVAPGLGNVINFIGLILYGMAILTFTTTATATVWFRVLMGKWPSRYEAERVMEEIGR